MDVLGRRLAAAIELVQHHVEAGIAVGFLKKIARVCCFEDATHALLAIEELRQVAAQDIVFFDNADGNHGRGKFRRLMKF